MNKLTLALRRWHEKTTESHRTIENLIEFLATQRLTQKEEDVRAFLRGSVSREDETMKRFELRAYALLLASMSLPFVLTRNVADALVRPNNLYNLEVYGYSFFLDHYHEHPWLAELVSRTAEHVVERLQVRPIYPADDNLMAWLYDPWNDCVYQFSRYENGSGATGVSTVRGKVVASYGAESSCVKFKDDEHPFVGYRKRLRAFKKETQARRAAPAA